MDPENWTGSATLLAQHRGDEAGKRKIHTRRSRSGSPWLPSRETAQSTSGPGTSTSTRRLIHAWKKQLLAGAEEVFAGPAKAASADAEARQAQLFEQSGRLKREPEWMKTKVAALG